MKEKGRKNVLDRGSAFVKAKRQDQAWLTGRKKVMACLDHRQCGSP